MGNYQKGLVLIRGAGDLATGIIIRLVKSGFRVLALETAKPLAIRRTVAFANAMYEQVAVIEGVTARKTKTAEQISQCWQDGEIPIVEDPNGYWLQVLKPEVLVDAIVAKKNLGTHKSMAKIVVAIGPGFCAGKDVHAVIETNRGHNLGRVINDGYAEPNTGVPGEIGGFGAERVVHAPCDGDLYTIRKIGDEVKKGEPIITIKGQEKIEILSPLDGILRGVIHDGLTVFKGLKIADVDPRSKREHCFSVSDKARSIGGGVLEAILNLGGRPYDLS